ncbi:MAG: Uncharacterised protein [Flavobacteriia bacterium]|nr:MAG: Uncharacterised protein [Flavobacteriia bacterium]
MDERQAALRLVKTLRLLWAAGFLVACDAAEEASTTPEEQLSGRWTLAYMDVVDSLGDAQPYMGGMRGSLLYHPSGTMSLHLTPENYPDPMGSFSNFDSLQSVEHLKHLANFYSYTGSYRIENDSVLLHRSSMHSNPREWNRDSRRAFRLSGDSLFMRPLAAGLERIRLLWIKDS